MKVLIVSTPFMDMAHSYKRAFESLDVECHVLLHQETKNPSSVMGKIAYYVKRRIWGNSKEIEHSINDFSEEVLAWSEIYKPNMVLDLLGSNLNTSSIEWLEKNSIVVIKYMLDLIENYSYLQNTLSYYDYVYTYESYDIERIKKAGVEDVRLLLATYDSEKYYPKNCIKEYDISFVGKIYTKEQYRRYKLLRAIATKYKNKNVAVYGVVAKPYQLKRYFWWLFFDHGRIFKNKNITAEEVNNLYNKSRIVININSYQTKETWSSRVLEMMATNAIVMTDATDLMQKKLQKGVIIYNDEENMLDTLDNIISQKCDIGVIENAKHILEEFTMKNTVQKIIEDYKSR